MRHHYLCSAVVSALPVFCLLCQQSCSACAVVWAGEARAVVGKEVAHPRARERFAGRGDTTWCEQSRERVHQTVSSACIAVPTTAWNPQWNGPVPPVRMEKGGERSEHTHMILWELSLVPQSKSFFGVRILFWSWDCGRWKGNLASILVFQ